MKWEELFSCSDRITVACCDETMERCKISDLNCTICYCTDGRYADRKRYQQLWKKHQTDFQTALKLYDEKLRHCGRKSECNEIISTTAKPVSETEHTTDVQEPTMNIHPEDGTAQLTEFMIGIETTAYPVTSPSETSMHLGNSATVMTNGITDDVTSSASITKISSDSSTPQSPTVITPTPATIVEGSCDIAFNGTCYWTHVENSVNFARAEEICSNNASMPAYFPNEEVYNSVVEDIRSKIPTGWNSVDVLTGVTIDTNTGNVTHPRENTYLKWRPGYPVSLQSFIHVVIDVKPDPDNINQGMYNYRPQWDRDGVVCQKTIG